MIIYAYIKDSQKKYKHNCYALSTIIYILCTTKVLMRNKSRVTIKDEFISDISTWKQFSAYYTRGKKTKAATKKYMG